MRVIICDAHRVFADALASLLRARGHQVVGSALDLGEMARMLAGAAPGEPVDACVIDLPRPGRRPEIEQAVAGAPQTPFVVLSGSADPSALRQAASAGVGGLALKRDDFGEFLRVLHRGRRPAGPGRGRGQGRGWGWGGRGAGRAGHLVGVGAVGAPARRRCRRWTVPVPDRARA